MKYRKIIYLDDPPLNIGSPRYTSSEADNQYKVHMMIFAVWWRWRWSLIDKMISSASFEDNRGRAIIDQEICTTGLSLHNLTNWAGGLLGGCMSSYSIIIISDQILIKRWQEKEILGDSTYRSQALPLNVIAMPCISFDSIIWIASLTFPDLNDFDDFDWHQSPLSPYLKNNF